MSINYDAYTSDSTPTTSDDDSDSGGERSDARNVIMTPNAAIEGSLTRVFGHENSIGHSLALVWEDVVLKDGCLYHDPEKDKFKVFSWLDVVGQTPEEKEDLTADDALEILTKSYAGTDKRYELVEAVVPDKDDPAPIGDVIMWYSGDTKTGPKSASVTLAKILTTLGNDAVVTKDDLKRWLAVTDPTQNLLRDDLKGRRLLFFEVKKESNKTNRMFHHAIVVDAETGSPVRVNNDVTEADDEAEPEVDDPAPAVDAVPDPIADFVSTCRSLGFDDEERAQTLLADLITDESNDLTADMVTEFGGEDAILGMVSA